MIRGKRERSEMKMGPGMAIVTITQCDLKRTVQISDNVRKYFVTPLEAAASSTSTSTSAGANAPPAGSPSTRGGVVTYTTTSIDTGERRDMFGFKARHVKTTTTIQSSPDACNPVDQRIERDGWYIDFTYGLQCDIDRSQMMGGQYAPGGCRDRYQFKRVGTGRDGYPLLETTTMYGPGGQALFTSSQEVVELSRDPLDPALFDVPAGYTETQNSQELYMPAMGSMGQPASSIQQAQEEIAGSAATPSASSMNASEPGKIRVGVVQLTNRSGRQISTDSLRERLISNIQDDGLEAIALNALTPTDAEAEAKAKRCDFILYTDIAALKASKLGGMFGRVAGVSGAGKTESKIEFKLLAVGDRSLRLQSATSAKEEGDEASAGVAIDQEATMVKREVLKSKP
jgi:hypothetical protein